MKKLLSCLIVIALATGVSACGNRGKLKTPTQVKAIEAKKARKAEKEQHGQDKVKDEAMQPPELSSSPSEDNGAVPLPGQVEPVASAPPPPADMKK